MTGAREIWRWPGSDHLTDRAGQCYTLAMEAVLANRLRFGDRLFLVHGLLHADRSSRAAEMFPAPAGTPPANPHAWVEVEADDGVMALDPVLRVCDERGRFYAVFGCEVVRRYRSDIAILTAVRRGNYGPWDRTSLAQWEARQRHARQRPEWSMASALARFVGDR